MSPIVIDPEGSDIPGESARLREQGPVSEIILPGGVPGFAVVGLPELKTILAGKDVSKDPRDWSAYRRGEISEDSPLYRWVGTRSMFTTYGDDHSRLREPVAKVFTRRRTDAMGADIHAIAEDLVTSLDATPTGSSVDLREQYAYPLPLRVLNELLGVSEYLAGPLRKCVDGIFDFVASPEKMIANQVEMFGLLQDLVDYRRDEPGDDMTSTLISHVDDPTNQFTAEDLVGTLYLTVNAGHETTVNLIDQAITALLTHPQHLAAVLDGRLSWTDVIEEALRYAAPIAYMPLRYARKDLVLGGETIPRGSAILVSYAGAGRDARVYGDTADTFDPTRANKDHISFGHGAHRCVGAPLARMEAQVALPMLFRQFPHMKLAVDPHEIGGGSNFVSNGHRRLPAYLHSK
ncbi:cytochrome P450 [Nocardia sp. BMG51109]|uniref:cytochrome P450 family protein n=1 Tax=Nocardia sp. BMG51109 TaxID=1056816 RepID=UPI00046705F1|nr:cytochrome P450 [Nocardia sp. BMG51109]